MEDGKSNIKFSRGRLIKKNLTLYTCERKTHSPTRISGEIFDSAVRHALLYQPSSRNIVLLKEAFFSAARERISLSLSPIWRLRASSIGRGARRTIPTSLSAIGDSSQIMREGKIANGGKPDGRDPRGNSISRGLLQFALPRRTHTIKGTFHRSVLLFAQLCRRSTF